MEMTVMKKGRSFYTDSHRSLEIEDMTCHAGGLHREASGLVRRQRELEGKWEQEVFIMDFIGKNSSGRLCRFKIGYYEQSQWSGVYIKPELSGTPVLE